MFSFVYTSLIMQLCLIITFTHTCMCSVQLIAIDNINTVREGDGY